MAKSKITNLDNVSRERLIELLRLAFNTLDSAGSYFASTFQEFPRDQWDEFDSEASIACDIDDAMLEIATATGAEFKPIFDDDDREFVNEIDFKYSDDDDEDEDDDEKDWDDDYNEDPDSGWMSMAGLP